MIYYLTRHRRTITLLPESWNYLNCNSQSASYAEDLYGNNIHKHQPNSLHQPTEIYGKPLGNQNSGILHRFNWINDYGPCFPTAGKNIEVLNEPKDFYNCLKVSVF